MCLMFIRFFKKYILILKDVFRVFLFSLLTIYLLICSMLDMFYFDMCYDMLYCWIYSVLLGFGLIFYTGKIGKCFVILFFNGSFKNYVYPCNSRLSDFPVHEKLEKFMEDVKYGIYPLTAFIAQPQQSKTRAPTPESCKSDKASSLEPQVLSVMCVG